MTARKIGFVLLLVVVILGIAVALLLSSWRKTPYGTLHVNAALVLKLIEFRKMDIFADNATPTQIREASASGRSLLQKSLTPVQKIQNTTFPGPEGPVPIRIYTPDQGNGLPVIIYYHGGGWVIGSIDSHDNICRSLANKASVIVVSVGYRLAPENPFPAAIDDAYAAFIWVSKNISTFNGNPDKIAVAGDSAGGNLAAAVSLMNRDRAGPGLSAQILIYPSTNLSSLATESHRQFEDGYFLTKNYIENFRSMYLPNPNDWKKELASPLLASNLSNLPPALVLTAEFDPLRDEGEAFAEKLKDSGTSAKLLQYKGMIHGFVGMDRLFDKSEQAIEDITDFLREVSN